MSMWKHSFIRNNSLCSRGQYVLYFLLIWSYVTRSTKLFNDWFFHHVNCAWDDRLLLTERKHLIIHIYETLYSLTTCEIFWWQFYLEHDGISRIQKYGNAFCVTNVLNWPKYKDFRVEEARWFQVETSSLFHSGTSSSTTISRTRFVQPNTSHWI